jgi:hypothetical protein
MRPEQHLDSLQQVLTWLAFAWLGLVSPYISKVCPLSAAFVHITNMQSMEWL